MIGRIEAQGSVSAGGSFTAAHKSAIVA